MSRLSLEFARLYLLQPTPGPERSTASDAPGSPARPDLPATPLVAPDGTVRALVLERVGREAWDDLGRVWRGVQAELDWPAPAIAVSGTDALQLWFSLASPLPAAEAHAVLQALVSRFLPDAPAARLRRWPRVETLPTGAPHGDAVMHVANRPGDEVARERWSAFVAPDLAPVFSETPWLDLPPGDDGQAALLAGLRSLTAAALEGLRPATATTTHSTDPGPARFASDPPPATVPASPQPAPSQLPADAFLLPGPGDADPRRFLLGVMNDDRVPLALRIDAAKALLGGPTR